MSGSKSFDMAYTGHFEAQAFTTDNQSYAFDTSGAYTFQLMLGNSTGGATPTVEIWTSHVVSTHSLPDSSIATLAKTAGTIGSGASLITFSPSGSSFNLDAGTTYFVVFKSDSTTEGNGIGWQWVNSSTGLGSPMPTWQIPSTDTFATKAGASEWVSANGTPYLMEVTVPEPHQYGLLAGLGLLGFVAYRNRNRLAKLA